MISKFLKIGLPVLFIGALFTLLSFKPEQPKEFQGRAIYFTKSKLELGRWGERMSEAQKKQVKARLKNRLEKTYTLDFNVEASVFEEKQKLDAYSGATDSWGKNFARGTQYKNVKENKLIQSQEFYGKKFLVVDELEQINWQMGQETKKIGNYDCYKAVAAVPTENLKWFDFSWSELRQMQNEEEGEGEEKQIEMTTIEAWYTMQIPVRHGPAEFWGLPGLILEVSAGDTVMLCSEIQLNPEDKVEITPPSKGKEITKKAYKETIIAKMTEMRNNMGRRRG
jgi:GLPGLI family protein